MDLTIPTDPQERTYTDDKGIVWTYKVEAALQDNLLEAMQVVGVSSGTNMDASSPEAMRSATALALKQVSAIVSAVGPDGLPVSINGKPASDPAVLALALRAVPGLAMAAANEAIGLGGLVVVERENLESAPA